MTGLSSHRCNWTRGALLFGALAATAAAVLLAPAAVPAAPSVFPICIEMGGQAGPDIAGDLVVWTDNRNGDLDIYGRDLGRRRNVVVCRHEGEQSNPSVTQYALLGGALRSIVVWVDKRNHQSGESADIYGRDVTLKEDFVVARSATLKWFPEIVDRWVVWVEADDAAGPYRIKARDLDLGQTYLIATSRVLSPVGLDSRVDGTKTVYTAVYTSGIGNISARNLPEGAPFSISQRSTFEWWPDISHNRVTWWESGGRIMMRDLTTGRKAFVHEGSRPRIDGELVTWDGGGNGGTFSLDYAKGARIFVQNVAHFRGVTTIGQQHLTCLFPAISGRTVVWESGPANRVLSHIHIYGARVPR